MWKVLCLVGLVGLAGCQSFTPEQAAAVEAVIPCDPLAVAVGAILAAQK